MNMQSAGHVARFKAHSSRHSQIDGASVGDCPATCTGHPLIPDSSRASPGGRPGHGGAVPQYRCSRSRGTRTCPRLLV